MEKVNKKRGPGTESPYYKELKRYAALCGISVGKLCENAGVSSGTVYVWNRHEPEALRIKRSLDEYMAKNPVPAE